MVSERDFLAIRAPNSCESLWPRNSVSQSGCSSSSHSTADRSVVRDLILLCSTRKFCETNDLTSVALFDLRSNRGIRGFKGRPRPRGAASGDAKEREQDEENANCSPMVGHRIPIRVSQRAAPKRRDCATFLAKINWPLQVAESRRCRSRPVHAGPSADRSYRPAM